MGVLGERLEEKSSPRGIVEYEFQTLALRSALFPTQQASQLQTPTANTNHPEVHTSCTPTNMDMVLATQQFVNEMIRLAGPGMKVILMDRETVSRITVAV